MTGRLPSPSVCSPNDGESLAQQSTGPMRGSHRPRGSFGYATMLVRVGPADRIWLRT